TANFPLSGISADQDSSEVWSERLAHPRKAPTLWRRSLFIRRFRPHGQIAVVAVLWEKEVTDSLERFAAARALPEGPLEAYKRHVRNARDNKNHSDVLIPPEKPEYAAEQHAKNKPARDQERKLNT
ncbi:MAG: hypothetical protein WCD68_05475, partial [Candidatus Acidiferrum sp.]